MHLLSVMRCGLSPIVAVFSVRWWTPSPHGGVFNHSGDFSGYVVVASFVSLMREALPDLGLEVNFCRFTPDALLAGLGHTHSGIAVFTEPFVLDWFKHCLLPAVGCGRAAVLNYYRLLGHASLVVTRSAGMRPSLVIVPCIRWRRRCTCDKCCPCFAFVLVSVSVAVLGGTTGPISNGAQPHPKQLEQ